MSALATQALTMSVEEFYQLPDDSGKMELIDGELYISPPPTNFHQKISSNIEFALNLYLFQQPIGLVYHAPFGVRFDDRTALQPDVLFVSQDNYSKFDEDDSGMSGAPDLAIEILSPGTTARDLGEKRQVYKKYLVKEIWFISPPRRTVEIERLGSTAYLDPILLTEENEVLRTPLLPGFKVTLATIFDSPLPFHRRRQ